jgi:uncharacterized membrane protein
LGWNWHQRQQRAILANNDVQMREDDINHFYNTGDVDQALAFLKTYNVQYIINGQLESGLYSTSGLMKFFVNDGIYWKTVYKGKSTTIYKVIP